MKILHYMIQVTRLKMICGLFCAGLTGLFLFCFVYGLGAEEEKEEIEIKTVIKEIQGEVSYLSPRINPQYISVTYKEERGTAYEMVLFIDEDLEVEHKRDLSEIGIGDTVGITYHEITEIPKEGRERTKRVAKILRFVRPADEATRKKYGLIKKEEPPVEGGDAGYGTGMLRSGEKIKGYRE